MRIFSDGAGGVGRRAATTGERPRGMALLMVITALAVLTAISVDFAFNTRVDATLAANARDQLKAHYLARSALNLSRLLMRMQFQLDQQSSQLTRALPASGAAGAMVQTLTQALKNIKLWNIVPLDSTAVTAFIQGAAGTSDTAQEVPLSTSTDGPQDVAPGELGGFGNFAGAFSATITDEESKLNVNKLNNPGSLGSIAGQQLALLWQDPRWDFLFNEDNSWRERFSREEMLIHFKDYVDEDAAETNLNLYSPTELFVQGTGDERAPYTRYDPDYEPKNALLDSLDEISMIAGVTDSFLAAFRDRLTVYPDINSRLNVNTTDPFMVLVLILAAADDPTQPALRNPATLQLVLDELAKVQAIGPFVGITVAQFVGVLEAAGITVRPEVKHNAVQNNFLGDQSQTFTIQAVGEAGEVTKTITAVIRYNASLGKLLYYRED